MLVGFDDRINRIECESGKQFGGVIRAFLMNLGVGDLSSRDEWPRWGLEERIDHLLSVIRHSSLEAGNDK